MTRRRVIGWAALVAFLGTIVAANAYLRAHGLWSHLGPIPGPIPSGVWLVGVGFVVRDLAQLALGRAWAWAAIAVGVALSYWVAPSFAFASAAAFAWSESTDALIFTPLANRGTRLFVLGVSISGYAASVVDSALFVRLAFHSWSGWWNLTLAKIVFVLAATPIAWAVRRVLIRPESGARAVPLDVAA